MIECDECDGQMKFVYTKDEVKELLKDWDKGGSKRMVELNLNTLIKCEKCGYSRQMTRKEIFKAFKNRGKNK